MTFNLEKTVRLFLLSFAFLLFYSSAQGQSTTEQDILNSTKPIGSSFYRHLAFNLDVDLVKLERFERRGFGRAEIVTLVLISKISETPLKEFGKRRVRQEATLKELSEEAGLDYVTLYKVVQVIKKGIESQGDQNLPPPITAAEAKERIKEEKRKQKEKEKVDNKMEQKNKESK